MLSEGRRGRQSTETSVTPVNQAMPALALVETQPSSHPDFDVTSTTSSVSAVQPTHPAHHRQPPVVHHSSARTVTGSRTDPMTSLECAAAVDLSAKTPAQSSSVGHVTAVTSLATATRPSLQLQVTTVSHYAATTTPSRYNALQDISMQIYMIFQGHVTSAVT